MLATKYERKLNIDIPEYQKRLLEDLKEASGVRIAEIVRRAIDSFLWDHLPEFKKIKVELPQELKNKNKNMFRVSIPGSPPKSKK